MLDAHIRQIAERVAASEGLQVLEVEVRGGKQGLLRIVIDRIASDKPEGVTHHDCETVSRQVSAILDVEDPIPHRYTLEVSSPGVERKLNDAADFVRYTGKLAKVVVHAPFGPDQAELSGQGAVRGRIISCADGVLMLEVAGKRGITRLVAVALDNVSRA